jgi:hypothetical protein
MMSGSGAEAYTEGDAAADTAADMPTMSARGRMAEAAGPDHGSGHAVDKGQVLPDLAGGNVGRRVHSGTTDAAATIAKLLGR